MSSARPYCSPCRESTYVRADALAILGKDALPELVEMNPLRRLATFSDERQITVYGGAVGGAQRRQPTGAEGTNSDRGGDRQQVTGNARLLDEFASRGGPRCLASLDRATWWYPPAHSMPNKQDVGVGRVGNPDLCGTPLESSMAARPSGWPKTSWYSRVCSPQGHRQQSRTDLGGNAIELACCARSRVVVRERIEVPSSRKTL